MYKTTVLPSPKLTNCSLNLCIDEGGHGVGLFLAEIGLEAVPESSSGPATSWPSTLYRLSDATGKVTFDSVDPVAQASLASSDAFLLDDSKNTNMPAIYVWIGRGATLNERRLALQYAQAYLYREQQASRGHVATTIVKMSEGHETDAFLHALGA